MNISLYQGVPFPSNIKKNLEVMEKNLQIAVENNSEVVVFPECFPTGCNIKLEEFIKLNQIVNQREAIAKLAKKYQTAIVSGLVALQVSSSSDKKVENVCCFWDKNGNILHEHKKVFLWGNENNLFDRGDKFDVFYWKDICVGLSICFEAEFPEAIRALAIKGATLIFCVSANMGNKNISKILVPARALENKIFMIYCNQVGLVGDLNCFGESVVVDPNGDIVGKFQGNEVGLKSFSIDMSQVNRDRKIVSYVEIQPTIRWK